MACVYSVSLKSFQGNYKMLTGWLEGLKNIDSITHDPCLCCKLATQNHMTRYQFPYLWIRAKFHPRSITGDQAIVLKVVSVAIKDHVM